MNELIKIIGKLREKNKTISTMESCTGGFLASTITNIEGASDIFHYGAVTYSNEFKIKMGVDANVIEKHTVYSIETAKSMAQAISKFANSNYGIGITGKLNRADKNNETEKDNMVYLSIYDVENDKYYTNEIQVDPKPRKELKEDIIKTVILLLTIIEY